MDSKTHLPETEQFTDHEDLQIWQLALEFQPIDSQDPGELAHQAASCISQRFETHDGRQKPVYFRFRFQLLPTAPASNLLSLEEKMMINRKFMLKIPQEQMRETHRLMGGAENENPGRQMEDVVVKTEPFSPKKPIDNALQTQQNGCERASDPPPKQQYTRKYIVVAAPESSDDAVGDQFTRKEQVNMWKFLFENFEKLEATAMWHEFKKSSEVLDPAKTVEIYEKECREYMLPRLHLVDCDEHTKIKIYRKFAFPVQKEYISELQKHADLILDFSGQIIENFIYPRRAQRKRGTQFASTLHSDPSPPSKRSVTVKQCLDLLTSEAAPTSSATFHEQISQIPTRNFLQSVAGAISTTVNELAKTSNDHLIEMIVNKSTSQVLERIKKSEDILTAKMDDISGKLDGINRKDQPGKEPSLEEYLISLKAFTSSLNLPDTKAIEKRIEAAIQKQKGQKRQPMNVQSIQKMLDVGLRMIGH